MNKPFDNSLAQSVARFAVACLVLATAVAAQPQAILPVINEDAQLTDKLGAAAALGTTFVDEQGNEVVLDSLVSGERPILLNLGYFNCPLACGPILKSIVDCLQNAELVPGRDLDILSVSINEHETPAIAGSKRQAFLELLGIVGAADHWRFLTSPDEATIRTLTESVGYGFAYVETIQQYDHPPVVVLLSPSGDVTRYLNGETMTPVTLKNAIIEASDGQVGSFLERILVSCLTYDPSTGEYTVAAMTIMRVGGAVSVLALGLMIYVLWRRERNKPDVAAATAN